MKLNNLLKMHLLKFIKEKLLANKLIKFRFINNFLIKMEKQQLMN